MTDQNIYRQEILQGSVFEEMMKSCKKINCIFDLAGGSGKLY